MKVILINGSPHAEGCVFTALSEVAGELEKNDIGTAIYQLGSKPVRGCVSCGKCFKTRRCVFNDDPCNEIIGLIQEADGVVVGSPVYYAGPNGALLAVLDRVFFAGSRNYAHKPAAAVLNCRRGGSSAAFDRLNKYFTISEMPVVSSQYWNSVHGYTPDDVRKDLEGLQVMRAIGRNMAYLLKSIDAGKQPLPEREKKVFTNFID
jgi:multimeric flavodoxin WrbA